MLFTLVISIFFGFVAAAALSVDAMMVLRGLRAMRTIRAELAALDRAATARDCARSPSPVRRGQPAFA